MDVVDRVYQGLVPSRVMAKRFSESDGSDMSDVSDRDSF